MSKLVLRAVNNNNQKGAMEWVTSATCPNETMPEIIKAAKDNDIFIVLLPVTVINPKGEAATFGDNPKFVSLLQQAGVNAMSEVNYDKYIDELKKGGVKMENNNVKANAEAMVKEWDAKFEEVAEHIIKNGSEATVNAVNGATEEEMIAAVEEALNKTGNATAWTGTEEQKAKHNFVVEKFNSVKEQAMKLGIWVKLGKFFKRAWAKVWATLKGVGKFSYHTTKIVGKSLWNITKNIGSESLNAGKQIKDAFMDDIVNPVRKA